MRHEGLGRRCLCVSVRPLLLVRTERTSVRLRDRARFSFSPIPALTYLRVRPSPIHCAYVRIACVSVCMWPKCGRVPARFTGLMHTCVAWPQSGAVWFASALPLNALAKLTWVKPTSGSLWRHRTILHFSDRPNYFFTHFLSSNPFLLLRH